MAMKDSGGSEGGGMQFIIGFLLSALALYFFFDSVRVRGFGGGIISRSMAGGGGMGMGQTTSMGILFVPFLIGVIGLFYDAKKAWAWVLFWLGLAVLVVEILSSLRFEFNMKTTALLTMFIMFGAGAGLMLRSYREPPGGGGGSGETSKGAPPSSGGETA